MYVNLNIITYKNIPQNTFYLKRAKVMYRPYIQIQNPKYYTDTYEKKRR